MHVFYGREFESSNKLYSSPTETEYLINDAKSILKTLPYGIIYDVGTGTGIVGLTIALEMMRKVIGVDVASSAIKYATRNASLHDATKFFSTRKSDYLENLNEKPALIVACLPWGSKKYLLESNKNRNLGSIPQEMVFPKGGPMGSYKQLIKQIVAKGWSTSLLIEVGCMPKKLVRKEIHSVSQDAIITFINHSKTYGTVMVKFKEKPITKKMKWVNLAPKLCRQRVQIECNIDRLVGRAEIKDYMIKLSEVTKMHVLQKPFTHPAIKNNKLVGYGGWIHWVTSGCSVYSYDKTWTKNGHYFLTIDCYTCKPFSVVAAVKFTKEYFGVSEIVWKEV
ncbi:MAG: 50S ribosomal protein L11 methyltransferase [Candidatus Pacebacteria bacterium]|nr:50S ribosomal protein L11 methyltransferase [Candidatus Paceibacterota bacterium]